MFSEVSEAMSPESARTEPASTSEAVRSVTSARSASRFSTYINLATTGNSAFRIRSPSAVSSEKASFQTFFSRYSSVGPEPPPTFPIRVESASASHLPDAGVCTGISISEASGSAAWN